MAETQGGSGRSLEPGPAKPDAHIEKVLLATPSLTTAVFEGERFMILDSRSIMSFE